MTTLGLAIASAVMGLNCLLRLRDTVERRSAWDGICAGLLMLSAWAVWRVL